MEYAIQWVWQDLMFVSFPNIYYDTISHWTNIWRLRMRNLKYGAWGLSPRYPLSPYYCTYFPFLLLYFLHYTFISISYVANWTAYLNSFSLLAFWCIQVFLAVYTVHMVGQNTQRCDAGARWGCPYLDQHHDLVWYQHCVCSWELCCYVSSTELYQQPEGDCIASDVNQAWGHFCKRNELIRSLKASKKNLSEQLIDVQSQIVDRCTESDGYWLRFTQILLTANQIQKINDTRVSVWFSARNQVI